MLNLKLYTYKDKASITQYIEKNKGVSFLTLSEYDEKTLYDNKTFIDLTSIADALNTKNNPGLIFNIEQNIINITKYNDEIKFSVKYDLSEIIINKLFFVFNETTKLNDEDIPLTNNTEIETNENKIMLKELSEQQLEQFINTFNSKLIGHNNFKSNLAQNLREFRIFNKIGEHKILSIFLFGTSGIGKTEVARIMHKLLAPTEKMIKISFGNYSSQGALNSLIGSPRGFIGSEDGELNTKIEKSKSTIILIDEFEKADKSVINFFLELLEEGKYTDMQGIEHDLNGYIIIFTSNLTEKNIIDSIPPEFMNRLNYKCKFNFLNEDDKIKYLKIGINDLCDKFNKHSKIELTEEDKNIFSDINVSMYSSIRDIEQEIKKRFIKLINQTNHNNSRKE